MNKTFAIQFQFDIKTIRKAVFMLTDDIMSDEEITAKFFDRDPLLVKAEETFSRDDLNNSAMAFAGLIIADDQPKKEIKKSKFQQKLEEAMEKSKASKS
ncbi:hypothetical protein [Mongoliibacter ruber]|nr:hypothetical protein [Mongoliibacter ruber]